MRFARHFQDIAGGGGWGPLNDKMAVLYLDGNGFSGIQQDLINAACEGKSGDELDEAAIEAQKKFDKTLKDYRAQFLRTLLEKATTDTDGAWKNGNDRARKDLDGDESADTLTGRIRLETLLWGGDEIMMVMPAWQGWAVARLFLEESKDWAIEGHPLHHALGLVFCNHKAPIHRITKLARDLADHAKDVVGRDGSSLAYQVLESFDHLGAGPEAHFNGLRLNGASSVRTLMLTAEAVNALDTHLPTLRGDGGLPQRQLKRLVRALFVHRDQDQAKETFKTLAIDRHAKEALDSVLATLSGAPSDPQSGGASAQGHGTSDHWHAWYHLEQLWDYVKPQRAKPADEEAEA
jgi:GNAT superfamily N-acetyltransferase